MNNASTSISIRGLQKVYGNSVEAVKRISLEINVGELVALLGPSGCGKTTTMRCVAGLEKPTAGEIYFGDTLMASPERNVFVPPEQRRTGMVFQSYAVWPHLTVFDNVAFPLRIQKYPRNQIRDRVFEALRLTKMEMYADRYPSQLSGGQQQRVALSRAIVANPRVLLFDEPLSNLDARLRDSMRFEISRLQKELGITTMYVTHDQSEAMVMADRIVVMNEGRIVQIGRPDEIYREPADPFVATFVGDANLLPVRVVGGDGAGMVKVQTSAGLQLTVQSWEQPPAGTERLCLIRPEDVELATEKDGADGEAVAIVKQKAYFGGAVEYEIDWGGERLRVRTHPRYHAPVGAAVTPRIHPSHCVLLPARDDHGQPQPAPQRAAGNN